MGEMALGYGSEYQLLRFLGHHRNFLNEKILAALKLSTETQIDWLDYPVDNKRLSLNGELKGITCLKSEPNFAALETAWKNFWPQSGNSQN